MQGDWLAYAPAVLPSPHRIDSIPQNCETKSILPPFACGLFVCFAFLLCLVWFGLVKHLAIATGNNADTNRKQN